MAQGCLSYWYIQEAYDKQILRDWLTEHGYQKQFDDARNQGKEPTPPTIPTDIIQKMTNRYITAFEKIISASPLSKFILFVD